IRDRNVTGVQTCALPISSHPAWNWSLATPDHPSDCKVIRGEAATIAAPQVPAVDHTGARKRLGLNGFHRALLALLRIISDRPDRSEERRVGKERRIAWRR